MRMLLRTTVALLVLQCSAAVPGCWAQASASDVPAKRVFVTSTGGNGNLSTWAGAGGLTGLAAGDAICRARASAAGLANPTAFRAWLSDYMNDAYCRVQNLSGKKSQNCAQATLPAAAGPWVRVDGKPFGPSIDQLVAPTNQVFDPPLIDETGAVRHTFVWTGTTPDGTNTSNCANWTSAQPWDDGSTGTTDGGSVAWTSALAWTDGLVEFCSQWKALLCFESGAGGPLPGTGEPVDLAFVTSAAGSGDLSSWPQAGDETGIAAGDAICQSLAETAGLDDPARFRAWLSDATHDANSTFAGGGPWMRLDGTHVAGDATELTSGQIEAALNQTENGDYVGNVAVWTDTDPAGNVSRPTPCSNFTSDSGGDYDLIGAADLTSPDWTLENHLLGQTFCSAAERLYCLAAPLTVFHDGFESGTLGAWTIPSGG